jgi:hypothetical protein
MFVSQRPWEQTHIFAWASLITLALPSLTIFHVDKGYEALPDTIRKKKLCKLPVM